jgi:UDP-N-acetylglucosamine--N-acetylmuramyl-(pentapeptide) pyrophosphoryl-undecaprenol N-acetylglucosamine transferase
MGPPAERRVAVTGGGTAGHIFPALEFLRAYRSEFQATGYFIGCAAGLESRLVPAQNERLELIPGLPWARQGFGGRTRALACLRAGVVAARRILQRERTQLVIGAGGYAAFSTCVAAYTLRLPVVIHEANVEPGLANRFASRLADLVCVGFPETAKRVHTAVELTGVPVGPIAPSSPSVGPPWRFLVLGGSEGSPVLNREAPRLFGELRSRGLSFTVRHITGFADPAAISAAYAAAGVTAEVDSFVEDRSSVYQHATLALASAGVFTLAELSAAAIPSFLVPLPGAANNHQAANASAYSARTGAMVVPESHWDSGRLAAQIEAILSDPQQLRALRDRAASWNNEGAAVRVVHACERILLSRQPSTSLVQDSVAVK